MILVGSFQNFQRAPLSFLCGSPPGFVIFFYGNVKPGNNTLVLFVVLPPLVFCYRYSHRVPAFGYSCSTCGLIYHSRENVLNQCGEKKGTQISQFSCSLLYVSFSLFLMRCKPTLHFATLGWSLRDLKTTIKFYR